MGVRINRGASYPPGKCFAFLSALVLVILVATVPSVFAGEGGQPALPDGPRMNALTLKDCLDIALEKNHSRGVSRMSLEIAEAQHRQALSGYWPQIGAKAAYSLMDQDPNFVFPSKSMQIPASTVIATTPLGPIPISVPASSFAIPEQNVKLMDKKNF